MQRKGEREIPSFQQFSFFFSHTKSQLSMTWNDGDANPKSQDYAVEVPTDSSEQHC